MFSFIRNLFSSKPKEPPARITPVEFLDGLLRFRTDDPISLSRRTVIAEGPEGPMSFLLDVVSYDGHNKVYLAEVPEASEAYLESLGLDMARTTRVRSVLKVQSPQLPDYSGLTEELSVTGIRLNTKSLLKPRKVYELTLRIDGTVKKSLKFDTVVAWSAHKGDGTCHAGLRYKNINPDIFAEIARYIKAKVRYSS